MPEFDPIKIFKRMWAMRRWGRVLVILTLMLTGASVALGILSVWFVVNQWLATLVVGAVVLWVILIISYLESTSRLRRQIDIVISKGEHIQAILTDPSEASVDRYDKQLDKWDKEVERTLKGTQYERSWMSNAGLTKREDESKAEGWQLYLTIYKNYMDLRLKNLDEIRRSLL